MVTSTNEYIRAANELAIWQRGNATNFTSKLFDLIAKADTRNRFKLAKAFPVEVSVWQEWMSSPSPDVFFQRYKIAGLGQQSRMR